MGKPRVPILKTTTELNETQAEDITQEKVSEVVSFYRLLLVEYTAFKEEEAFDALKGYIHKHGRILYAPISNEIYSCYDKNGFDEAICIMGTVTSNMEKLVAYTESVACTNGRNNSQNSESMKDFEDTKKAVLKIWDHINLAQQQYTVLKQSDDEYKEKFERLISTYKEDMTKDMSNQLETIPRIV